MRTLILIASLAALLAGCETAGPRYGGGYGGTPPVTTGQAPGTGAVSPLARSATWTCEDLTKVVVTEGQPMAKATLNSGLELNLQHTAPGRWGAMPIEFRTVGGSEALWSNNGKTWRCRAM